MATQQINGSVGLGGLNAPADTEAVQTLLTEKKVYRGKIDKLCGPKTVEAIKEFQANFMRRPDGLIDPNGITWKKLTGMVPMGPPLPRESTPLHLKLSEEGHQFIFDIEVGKLLFLSRRLHWPGDNSGVTIGSGYDMKARSSDAIKRDMLSIGLSDNVATKISEGAGLGGEKAKMFCEENKDLVSLNKNQQFALLKLIVPHYEEIVRRNITVPLKQHEFDALVSFAYNPIDKVTPVTNNINEGKIDEAMKIILSRVPASTRNSYTSFITRRKKEIDLFKNGVYAGVV